MRDGHVTPPGRCSRTLRDCTVRRNCSPREEPAKRRSSSSLQGNNKRSLLAMVLADSMTIDLTHPIPTFQPMVGNPLKPDLDRPWLDSTPRSGTRSRLPSYRAAMNVIGNTVGQKTHINPFGDENAQWQGSRANGRYRNLPPSTLQFTITSVTNAISTIAKFSNKPGLPPWPCGTNSQPDGIRQCRYKTESTAQLEQSCRLVMVLDRKCHAGLGEEGTKPGSLPVSGTFPVIVSDCEAMTLRLEAMGADEGKKERPQTFIAKIDELRKPGCLCYRERTHVYREHIGMTGSLREAFR